MRVQTFYWIVSDDGKFNSNKYTESEHGTCRAKLSKLARANKGTKYHMLKRISSAIASDLTFEDSE